MGKEFQSCGASIIIYKDDRILLQRRKDNGCWGYHGGHVELGEKVEEAAKRELYEETGLKALSIELFDIFSGPDLCYIYPDGNKVHIIDVVYICKDFKGEIKLQNKEVTDLQWFDVHSIPENISPPVKPGLTRFVDMLKNKIL